MYVFFDDLFFKYIIPEQFEKCFIDEEIKIFGIENDDEFKCYEAITKIANAIERLDKHRKAVENITSHEYIEYLNVVCNFLNKHLNDAYLRLFSGDIYFGSSVEEFKNHKIQTSEN